VRKTVFQTASSIFNSSEFSTLYIFYFRFGSIITIKVQFLTKNELADYITFFN